MVSSRVYPSLERKPGGPDNWVEATGGLPTYIERIAKHLHYEQGMPISRAIAVAVNTVKRWARKGGVVKYGDPNNMHVTTVTAAQAAAAVAQWEAMKARARTSAPSRSHGRVSLSSGQGGGVVDLSVLVERANRIEDPAMRAQARKQIIDLATATPPIPVGEVIDLALTKDGRKSFRHRGKWKHGFIPVDTEAKVAKAKGSPIAMKRMNRLFGGVKPGRQIKIKAAKGSPTERINRVGQSRRLTAPKSNPNQRIQPKRVEVSRGRRPDARATKPWSEIKDEDKTIRDGKKYVLTTFHGEQSLTEWIGDPKKADVVAPDKRKYASISEATAKHLTSAVIRRMLEDHTIPPQVRKVLNAELRRKTKVGALTRRPR